MNCKNYKLCTMCQKISDVSQNHKDLKLLPFLLDQFMDENILEDKKLFYKVNMELKPILESHKMSKAQRNKRVSKYYIYLLKHRQFLMIESPSFSPIKKDAVQEFHYILNLFKISNLSVLAPVFDM